MRNAARVPSSHMFVCLRSVAAAGLLTGANNGGVVVMLASHLFRDLVAVIVFCLKLSR